MAIDAGRHGEKRKHQKYVAKLLTKVTDLKEKEETEFIHVSQTNHLPKSV